MGDGLCEGSPSRTPYWECRQCCTSYTRICNLHSFGPYGNMRDRKVLQFIGYPLVKFHSVNLLWGGDCRGSCAVKEKVHMHRSHQESWSPSVNIVNKDSFDNNIGFITESTSFLALPVNSPVNMADPHEYIGLQVQLNPQGFPITKACVYHFLLLLT